MNLRDKSIEELIDLALKTSCLKEMFFLHTYPAVNVRRALARNVRLSHELVENLIGDPVENVSYIACKHPKAKIKKDFNDVRACVLCEKDERGLNCVGCPEVINHSF